MTSLIDCVLPSAHHWLVARPRREDVSGHAEVVRVDGVAGETKLVENAVSERRKMKSLLVVIFHPFTSFPREDRLPELGPLVDDDLGRVSPRCPGLVEASQERLGEGDELAGLAAAPALLREGAVPVHRVRRTRYHHVRALKLSHVIQSQSVNHDVGYIKQHLIFHYPNPILSNLDPNQ